MKRSIVLAFLLLATLPAFGRKYPFDMNHPYEVSVVRVGQEGTKFLKAWGVAGNADKAIDQAMQDAVAACLFVGVEGDAVAGTVPAICGSTASYEQNKAYFDAFFKSGEFLQYVKNTNSKYPTGENNISTSRGRKVGIYVQVMYDALREKMEKDGIVKVLNSYF